MKTRKGKNKKKRIVEILVRGVILKNNKVLFCKKKNKNYYFLPGGHLEFGESIEEALSREIKEELGVKIKNSSFIGITEHLFTEEGKVYHEINIIYKIVLDKITLNSKEDHLEFFLFTKKQVKEKNILPKILKKALLRWLENKKPFLASQFRKKIRKIC